MRSLDAARGVLARIGEVRAFALTQARPDDVRARVRLRGHERRAVRRALESYAPVAHAEHADAVRALLGRTAGAGSVLTLAGWPEVNAAAAALERTRRAA